MKTEESTISEGLNTQNSHKKIKSIADYQIDYFKSKSKCFRNDVVKEFGFSPEEKSNLLKEILQKQNKDQSRLNHPLNSAAREMFDVSIDLKIQNRTESNTSFKPTSEMKTNV